MVRHHPAVRQVDVVLELHGDHLGIDLHDNALQPIPYTAPTAFVIAIYINMIADRVYFIPVGRVREMKSCQRTLLF